MAPVNAEDEANITLHNGDVVNIMLGIQIDGFPSIVAETLVIGASKESPVTDKRADLLNAAWTASEAALRTFKPSNRNWDVTNVVSKVAKEYRDRPIGKYVISQSRKIGFIWTKRDHS